MAYRDSRWRSVTKTGSWRISATVTTIILVYFFTGEFTIAVQVGMVEMVAKLVIFYLHERAWDKIRWGRKEIEPKVMWFTGLSGSGKSTVGLAVYEKLKKKGLKVEYLDGDKIREVFPSTGFTKKDRDMHIKRVGHLCSMLEKNGVTVIASFVSPYKETRDFVRNICKNFVEVYVSTPLEECERRDVKGLYAKARSGEIKNFTGIDDPYEAPENPELNIDTTGIPLEDAVSRVMKQAPI